MGDCQHLAHSVGGLAASRLHLRVGHPDQNRTEARATRHDVGVSWWERVRRKTRRIFSFLALSAGKGLLALWKPLKGAWGLVTGLGVITAAGVVALVSADVWLTGAVVVIALLVILLVGSFRLWDELDEDAIRAGASRCGDPCRSTLGVRWGGRPMRSSSTWVWPTRCRRLRFWAPVHAANPLPFGFVSLVIASFAGKTSPSGCGGDHRGDAGNCWSRASRTHRYFSNASERSQAGSEWRFTTRMLDAAITTLRLRHAVPILLATTGVISVYLVSVANGTTWKAVWIGVASTMFASGLVDASVQIEAVETGTSRAAHSWGASGTHQSKRLAAH